jgi:putative hydrolase of the HAD superfamily
MIKTIIFDYDGTLEEWHPYEAEVDVAMAEYFYKHFKINPNKFLVEWNSIRKYHIHPKAKPEEYSRVMWFIEIFERCGINEDICLIDKLVDQYWMLAEQKVRLFPHAKEVLEELHGKFKLALLTDSDGNRHMKLERIEKLGIIKYFDHIFTSDDIGVNKPDLKDFKEVLKQLGSKPKETIMVGDVPERDLLGAKKVGITTVWTAQGLDRDTHFDYVDYKIKDIRDVLKIIKQLNS